MCSSVNCSMPLCFNRKIGLQDLQRSFLILLCDSVITRSIFSVNIGYFFFSKILRRKKMEDIDQSFNIFWQCLHEPGRREIIWIYLKRTLLELSLLSEELTGALRVTDDSSKSGACPCPWSPWPLFPHTLLRRAQQRLWVKIYQKLTVLSRSLLARWAFWPAGHEIAKDLLQPQLFSSFSESVKDEDLQWVFLLISLQPRVGLHCFHQLLYSFQR